MLAGRSSESIEMHLAHNLQNETSLRRRHAQRLPDGVLVYFQTQLSYVPKLLQPERLSATKHAEDGHSSEIAVSHSSTQ